MKSVNKGATGMQKPASSNPWEAPGGGPETFFRLSDSMIFHFPHFRSTTGCKPSLRYHVSHTQDLFYDTIWTWAKRCASISNRNLEFMFLDMPKLRWGCTLINIPITTTKANIKFAKRKSWHTRVRGTLRAAVFQRYGEDKRTKRNTDRVLPCIYRVFACIGKSNLVLIRVPSMCQAMNIAINNIKTNTILETQTSDKNRTVYLQCFCVNLTIKQCTNQCANSVFQQWPCHSTASKLT